MAHIKRRQTKRDGVKWDAKYRDPEGRERCKTFDTKKAATDYLAVVEAEKQRGLWRDPRLGKVTFEEWTVRYLEGAVHKRRSTLTKDRTVIDNHLVPMIGSRPLASLTRLDVQRVVQAMSAKLSPATVRTNFAVLRAILNAAVDADILVAAPTRGINLPAKRKKEPKGISAAELVRLAEVMPPNYRAMVYVAGAMGLRLSEVLGLRVGRIDFLRRTLTVAETLSAMGGPVQVEDVKTEASRRTLTMPSIVAEVLSEHLALRGRPGPDELVFVSERGGPIVPTNFNRRVWTPAKEKAGLPNLTFHGLRHTSVALLIELGAHARVIQEHLGHASITTTMDVYGSVLPRVDQAVTSGLDAALRGVTLKDRGMISPAEADKTS